MSSDVEGGDVAMTRRGFFTTLMIVRSSSSIDGSEDVVKIEFEGATDERRQVGVVGVE